MNAHAEQLTFAPIVALESTDVDVANRWLNVWKHRLGPCERPFRQEAFLLRVGVGWPLAVAISASTVSATVAGYGRKEVVELARICAAPGARWATRVMLRLWREILGERWACWPVRAAVSYSVNAHGPGDIYRFDGWEKVRDDAGSSGGGGTYSTPRSPAGEVSGRKTLWLWRYE